MVIWNLKNTYLQFHWKQDDKLQIIARQRLYKYLDFKRSIAIYKPVIPANLCYWPPVCWMFVNKTDFEILQKVQEWALRFVHNVSDKRLPLIKFNDSSIRLITIMIDMIPCRWPVNSSYKRPVTRKCFHCMTSSCCVCAQARRWSISTYISYLYRLCFL